MWLECSREWEKNIVSGKTKERESNPIQCSINQGKSFGFYFWPSKNDMI